MMSHKTNIRILNVSIVVMGIWAVLQWVELGMRLMK
jgi:hypothetical protein